MLNGMKLTAQIKLLPTPQQAELLKATLERANVACNAISQYAWKNKVFNQFVLHGALYKGLRSEFELAVRCLGKVADSYKAATNSLRTFKKHGSIPYDSRILDYRQPSQTISIWVLGGREDMPYECGDRQRELLKHQKGESDLWFHNGTFYLLATCEIEEPT